MTDASWNTYTPSAPARVPAWLKAGGALAAGFALLVVLMVSYQQGMRRKAWPLARAVAARLATDEGTLDLWHRNPALHTAYPTEASFLDRVRPFRAGLALPEREPVRGRGGYATRAGLSRLTLQVCGDGGTWMELTLDTQGTVGGEGIAALWLADSRAGLRRLSGRGRASLAQPWQRFRETAGRLATPDGARSLTEQPGLARTPADAAAFLDRCRQRRDALAGLPAEVPGAAAHLAVSIHGGLFGRRVRMTCDLEGGGRLTLAWRGDRLTELDLD